MAGDPCVIVAILNALFNLDPTGNRARIAIIGDGPLLTSKIPSRPVRAKRRTRVLPSQ